MCPLGLDLLFQVFDSSTLRVGRAPQNQEKFQKTHFWKKNILFEAFLKFPTRFLILTLWFFVILRILRARFWKPMILESDPKTALEFGGVLWIFHMGGKSKNNFPPRVSKYGGGSENFPPRVSKYGGGSPKIFRLRRAKKDLNVL